MYALLQNSADQSGILPNNLSDNDAEASVIIHNGKKYSRVQIEGSADDEEFLMDENGDIYTLDFKFLTNMGDNAIIEDDW